MAFPIDMLLMRNAGSPSLTRKSELLDSVFLSGGANNGELNISSLGCAPGDTLVLCFATLNLTSDGAAPLLSGDATGAFDTAAAEAYANDTNDTNMFAYAQRLTGADATLTVDGTGLTTGSIAVHAILYSGGHASTTLDVATPTPATGTNGSLANPPAITPVTAGAKIIAFYASHQSATGSWTAPANMSNFNQNSVGTGPTMHLGSADKDWTSGAFNPDAVTGGDANAANSWAGMTLAIRPA